MIPIRSGEDEQRQGEQAGEAEGALHGVLRGAGRARHPGRAGAGLLPGVPSASAARGGDARGHQRRRVQPAPAPDAQGVGGRARGGEQPEPLAVPVRPDAERGDVPRRARRGDAGAGGRGRGQGHGADRAGHGGGRREGGREPALRVRRRGRGAAVRGRGEGGGQGARAQGLRGARHRRDRVLRPHVRVPRREQLPVRVHRPHRRRRRVGVAVRQRERLRLRLWRGVPS